MDQLEKDRKLLSEASKVRCISDDRSTKVGVLIYGADAISIEHANQFPQGVDQSEERHQRPTKYQYIEHAERNAIYLAARCGLALRGTTIYIASFTPGFPPCCDCARAIIQSGITRIVGKTGDNDPELWRADWRDSMVAACTMLQEANVRFDCVDYLPEVQATYELESGIFAARLAATAPRTT